ncbi:GNAT family N-acetyltransferase [Nocardioides nitrophenolicus]|uniref:GNAT family N-acetyltransferase n=1 Tax=Nocardioides nitrophenolicus TaxID=60489 RepID=UPI001959E40F|nr:GNAT family N-acetyltransferase [Nocardioides nitrophenolicus]MBM7518810.1 GNAT superfamily N-acetyltransferase/2'-5' RNA ligase [Nocardioides nitrophenolicus]
MRAPTRSALIVTVPEADGVVGPHRARFDRAAAWGVPAHVTVLFPFLPPEQVTPDVLGRLADAVVAVPAFTASFAETAWFGEDVLFLAPRPADRFVALTSAVTTAFPGQQPYGGAHAEVVPHLTVGHDAPVTALRAAEVEVRGALPVTAEIAAVELWQGGDEEASWAAVDALPLGRRGRATVRPARPDDVAAVVAVGHLTWPATYTPIAGAEYVRRGLAEWWSPAGTADAIAAGRVLVAESDGQVVGVATYSLDGEVVDLWKLYVVPSAQGTGAGAALLDAVVSGPGVGASEIRLAHLAGNERARAFYERHGFTETHRTADALGGPDSVWMRLPLRK